jgi:hypothetical protein
MKNVIILVIVLISMPVILNAAIENSTASILPIICDTSAAPDSFGYTWVDNDNGGSPVYNWRDISTIGVQVIGLWDDNVKGPIDIGFDFPYYWYYVDHLYIGSNGYISFLSNATYSPQNYTIPSTRLPNDLVAPLGGDLDFTRTSSDPQCYYYSNGIDTFIVSWINVREWPIPDDPDSLTKHTFQMILCKNDSSITFQYGPQIGSFENASTPGEHACQIGIEDIIGRTGLNYLNDWAPLANIPHDGLAVRIHPVPLPTFHFRDIGTAGCFNLNSKAEFVRLGTSFTPKGLVKNYGTLPATSISFNCNIKRGIFNYYNKTDSISYLGPHEEIWAIFPDTILNYMNVYSAIFRTTLSGDQYATNNRDTLELRPYTLPMAFGYVSDTINDYQAWPENGSGWGNEFQIPEPVSVTGVTTSILSDGVNPFYVYILPADINDNPDMSNILWCDTVQLADTGWVTIDVSPSLTMYNANQLFFIFIVESGPGFSMGTDLNVPYSNRAWQYRSTFSSWFDQANSDLAIRVICSAPSSGCLYVLGDLDGDSSCTGGDITYGIHYFKSIGLPPVDRCYLESTYSFIYVAADVNGNCEFRGSDITRLVQSFKWGFPLINCHFFQPQMPKKQY